MEAKIRHMGNPSCKEIISRLCELDYVDWERDNMGKLKWREIKDATKKDKI